MPTRTQTAPLQSGGEPGIPPLLDGERLGAAEFERRFDATPNLRRAELLDGVVSIPEARTEGRRACLRFGLVGWLGVYSTAIRPCHGGVSPHIRLDAWNMPQPDACLLISTEDGGRVRIDEDGYPASGPDLVAEIAMGDDDGNRHSKRELYRRHGVGEYLLWHDRSGIIEWRTFVDGEDVPLHPGPDGILRSRVFPGLWLDPAALIRDDMATVLRVVQDGIVSAEHDLFVARLRLQASANTPPAGGRRP